MVLHAHTHTHTHTRARARTRAHTHVCRLVYELDSGVMCLDLHPKHPFLLAVGLYDGECV